MANQNNVDKRVVQMEFDNEQFKKGTAETINALDRLTESLQFKEASKGITNIEKSLAGISLSPIEKGIDTISSRFSLFGNLAYNALNRISNKILDTAKSTTSFLSSLGQMANASAGFAKYEETVEATQTIMAATASEFENTGEQMEYVSEQLDRLRWFTDETSYSFTDMASNIGKFTSAGVDLKTAVASMRGIAAWAALSGANAQKASSAMYNFSQALGKGYMGLTDWRSLETANMATLEFKEQLVELAAEMGKLERVGDGMYRAVGAGADHVFNAEGMSAYLADKWFDTELIQKVLATYGDFSGKLNALGEATGFTAAEMLNMMDEFREGSLDLEKYAKIGGVGVQFLTDALTDLTSADMALGEKGLRAAQETKTFSDAINYVKDAVSSGWAKTYELIFGNYDQAKKLWSDMAEEMYDIFVKAGDDRNELLAEWADLGGRQHLVDSMFNSLKAVKNILAAIGDGFKQVFPPITADTLYTLTKRLSQFTANLANSEGLYQKVRDISTSFFNGLRIGAVYVGELVNALSPLGNVLKGVASAGLNLVKSIFSKENVMGAGVKMLQLLNNFSKTIEKFYNSIKTKDGRENVLANIINTLGSIKAGTIENLKSLTSALSNFAKGLSNGGFKQGFDNFVSVIDQSTAGIGKIYDKLKEFYGKWDEFRNKYLNGVTLEDIFNFGIFIYLILNFKKFLKTLQDFMASITKMMQGIQGFAASLLQSFQNLVTSIQGIFNSVKGFIDAKKQVELSKRFKEYAIAIAIIAGALFVLNKLDMEKLEGTVLGLFAIIANMVLIAKALEKINVSPAGAFAMIEFAIAIGLVAKTLADTAKIVSDFQADIATFLETAFLFGEIVVVFGILATALVGVSKSTSLVGAGQKILETANLFGLAAALLSFAVAIRIMVGALKDITKYEGELDSGLNTLGSLVVMMAMAIGALELAMKQNGSLAGVASSIVAFAIYIKIVVSTLIELGTMPIDVATDGLNRLGGLLTMITLAMAALNLTSKGTGLSGAAGTLIAFAIAMKLLIDPMLQLSQLPWQESAQAATAVFLGLIAIAGALALLNKAELDPLKSMGAAVSLLAIAAAVDLLTVSIMALSKLSWGQLITGLVVITTELAILGGLGVLLADFAPALIAVGGGLLMIAGASTLFGAGVALIAGAIIMLANVAPGAVETAATNIVKLAPALGEALVVGLNSLMETFDKYAPIIAQHFVSSIVKMIIAAIGGAIAGLIEGVKTAGTAIMNAIDSWNMKSYAAEKGAETVEGYKEGAESKKDDLVDTFSDIASEALGGAEDGGLNEIAGSEIGSKFISAMTGGVDSQGGNLVSTLFNLGSDGSSAVGENLNGETGSGIASDFMGGINDAIGQNANTVLGNLQTFGNNAVNITAAALNSVRSMMSGLNAALSSSGQIKEGAKRIAYYNKRAKEYMSGPLAMGIPPSSAKSYEDLQKNTLQYAAAMTSLQGDIAKVESQLNSAASGVSDWQNYVKDYVSGMDWKGIGEGAGNNLGEGLKSGASGGGGKGGGGGGSSGTAKEMAKVIEGECKVVMNETGHYIAENICAGLKEDSTIEEIAAGKAKNIKSAFQEVFDQFDIYQDYYDAQYDLWVAANPDATEIEKRRQELKNLGQQMTTVTKKLNAAQDELAQLSEELGEGSNEVVTMATEVTRLQTELENLNNTYNERAQLEPGVYIPQADLYQNGEIDYRELGMVFPEELVNMLAEIKGDFKSSGEELAAELTAGMTGQLTDDEEYLLTSIRTLMETTEIPILDSYDNYVDAGENLIFGFAKGLTSKNALARVEESSAYVANLATDTLNATLDINSPSKVAGISGRFFDEGFANNIVKYAFMSEDATQAMGENTIGVLQDTLKTVSDLVTADYEYSPVIKPIVDTTNVATAADYITSTFATPSSIRLGSRPDTPFNRNLRAIRLSMQDQEDYNYSREDETVSAINNLGVKLDKQEAAIRAMQVVMDSGELVGSIAGGMDQGLGTRAKYKRRGN